MPDKWKQISDLYHAALMLPENERSLPANVRYQ